MTTWKQKIARDTARVQHLPNYIGNLPGGPSASDTTRGRRMSTDREKRIAELERKISELLDLIDNHVEVTAKVYAQIERLEARVDQLIALEARVDQLERVVNLTVYR